MSSVQSTRGSAFTVTGVGFFKDTSATLWLDENANGIIDTGEVELGEAQVGGDFTFVKTITITNPPFKAGYGDTTNTNFINAVDGRSRSIGRSVEPLMEGKTLDDGYSIPLAEGVTGSGTAPGTTNPNCIAAGGPESCLSVLELRGTLLVTPTTAAIGDTVQVTLKDHNSGVNINTNGVMYLGGVLVDISRAGSTTATGEASFNITIPEGVPTGVQELNLRNRLFGDLIRVTRRVNMVISGPIIQMTPNIDLVPNQTVSLAGSGFSTGGSATINRGGDGSLVSISGNTDGLGSQDSKLNEGDIIEIDNGGNWSASFVIPINDTTTFPGIHVLKIVDSKGREGTVTFTIAERTLVLEPAESSVGTTVSVTGAGFPANNTGEGADFSPVVSLIYLVPGADISVAQLSPDSSGNINSSFRVPLRASIPSANTVRAEFDVDGIPVTTSVIHKVPPPTITVTPAEGPIGSMITIVGEGFKASFPLTKLVLAGIEILVSPVPSTDNVGRFEVTVQVPQLNTGAHILRVDVGGAKASGIFRVTEGPVTGTTPEGAIRSFCPASVAPSGEVEVTVTVANYGLGGAVTETLPAGFSYVSSSLSDDRVQVTGQAVRFTLLGETSFTYTVTASSQAGSYSFSGVLRNFDEQKVPVGGALRITVGAELSVTVTTSTTAPVRLGTPVPVTATFSEPVSGFTVDDIGVANGAVGNFTGSDGDAVYTFDVTPNATRKVTVDITADAATNAGGNGNTAAGQLSLGIPYDDDGNGEIGKSEVIKAINDYLFGDGSLGKSHVINLINLYLFG